MFGDEDDPGLRESVEVIALSQEIGVHHAAVVPGPPSSRAAIRALDFHVDLSSDAVCGQNIQPHGAVQQIFHKDLCMDFLDGQVGHFHDNPKNQFHTRGIALEAFCQEVVVHETKASEPLQILLVHTLQPSR